MNCECGCGQKINVGRMFIKGHNRRNSTHTEEFKIKTFNDVDNCEQLCNLNNIITLCKKCHKEKEHNWNIR